MEDKKVRFLTDLRADLIREKRSYENRLSILTEKINDYRWKSDFKYLNCEIDLAKKKISYYKYLDFLIENELKKSKVLTPKSCYIQLTM